MVQFLTSFKTLLNKECLKYGVSYKREKVAFSIFIFVCVFLLLYKPYFIENLSFKQQLSIAFSYAICGSLIYWITYLVRNPYKKYSWSVRQEIQQVSFVVISVWLLINLITFLLFNFIVKIKSSTPFYFSLNTFVYTVTIASIFYITLYCYNLYSIVLTISNREPKKLLLRLEKDSKMLVLMGKNKGEMLKLKLNQLLYLKSEGHYVKVYYLKHKSTSVTYAMIRASMKEMESNTLLFSELFRCHKSYLINVNYIKSITQISGKYTAILKKNLGKVSISKNKVSILKKKIKENV